MSYIHFKTLTAKNICSVGNQPITIQLDKHSTTAIVGENGSGKSTLLLDSLCFCLYGKPYRNITKNQLINNKNNRELLISVTFNKGNDEIVVNRGIKPNVFEIYINGKLQDENAKSKDYQEYLEHNVLGIDFVSFKQIVAFGKANYVPFMSLSAKDRRVFVERVLGLEVITGLTLLHKEKLSNTKQQLDTIKNDIRDTNTKIESQTRLIKELAQQSKQNDLSSIIAENKQTIQTLNNSIVELNNQIQSFNPKSLKENKDKLKGELENHKNEVIALNSSLKYLNESLLSDTDTVCKTCKQPITDEHIQSHNAKIEYEINNLNECIAGETIICNDIQSKIQELDKTIEKLKSIVSDKNKLENDLNTLIATTNKLEENQASNKTYIKDKLKTEKQTLIDLQSSLSELDNQYNECYNKLKVQDFASLCLKDSGIKSTIIAEYLPYMNNYINKNIKQIGLFATIKLDSEFAEEIKMKGFQPMTYNQMSEGEKLRMDMAIMMSWRDIAKMKNNMSCNLLIMDEIFDSSVDANGALAFAEMLKTVSNLNVFVITHTPEKLADSFHSFIRLAKRDGFTVIV